MDLDDLMEWAVTQDGPDWALVQSGFGWVAEAPRGPLRPWWWLWTMHLCEAVNPLPCPHARPSWRMCPHCLGFN